MFDNRMPRFAGKFYPGSPAELQEELKALFDAVSEKTPDKMPRAIISPHAGYMFSGKVAAAAFSRIPENATFSKVFVLASSHRYSFGGAAVFGSGNYVTPLGEVETDKEIASVLVRSHDVFRYHPGAHEYEHSLEVQLPFLQYRLGKNFQLVPIILGTDHPGDCKKIAEALMPWFLPENLFVISTDFSHYPAYDDAVNIDLRTADAICSNNPEELLRVIDENKRKKTENLRTSLCGWTSMLTLLYLTENQNIEFEKIKYSNSGDAEPYGDKEEVVGYWALAAYEKNLLFSIPQAVRDELLEKGKNAIENFLKTGEAGFSQASNSSEILKNHPGIFVSVYIGDELRGCVGNLESKKTLDKQVQQLAVSAVQDSRFKNPKIEELHQLSLEISILSPFRRIYSADEIIVGKHGIFIKKDFNSGIFLPHVAKRNEWSREQFLGYCSRDKAGLGWNGWKSAELYVFETFVFRG